MEWGGVLSGEAVYMGDVPDGSPQQRAAFIDRAREWKASHNLRLGEGLVRVVESEGEICYQILAPVVGKHDDFVERVCDSAYPPEDGSDTI